MTWILNRRGALLGAGACALASAPSPAGARPRDDDRVANLRVWTAPAAGVFRNIFAIESDNGLLVVDAPLRKSDGVAARDWLASLRKPLRGVLITHMHPDHNFGLTEMIRGTDVPVVATAAVADAIRSADPEFQRFVPNFIGEAETERGRVFPNTIARPNETITLDGIALKARDFGSAESAADAIWETAALPNMVFSGDLVFHRVHSWVANGTTEAYIAVLERLRRELPDGTVFCAGHGGLTPKAAIGRQIAYLERFRAEVRSLAAGRASLTDEQKVELARRMRVVEPSEVLAFGVAIGADAVAREMAGVR